MPPTNPLPKLAAGEVRRRVDAIDRSLSAGQVSPDRAAHLRSCWLAIGAAAHAHDHLPQLVEQVWILAPAARAGEGAAYRLQPHDLARAADWHAELTRAATAARTKAQADPANRAATDRSLLLGCLEIYCGVASPAPAPASAAARRPMTTVTSGSTA